MERKNESIVYWNMANFCKQGIKSFFLPLLLTFFFCITLCGRTVAAKEYDLADIKLDIAKAQEVIWDRIPDSAYEYAENYYKEFCQAAEDDLTRSIDYGSVELMKPYTIYDVSKEDAQFADFYFPIKDKDGVFLILLVMQTDVGMTCSVSDSMCDLIDEETYENSFFYRINGKVHIENTLVQPLGQKNNKQEMVSDKKEQEFLESDTNTKLNTIVKNTLKLQKVQTEKMKNAKDGLEEYLPGFSVDEVGKKVCNTGSYMTNQQGESICWAACVASIYNYFFDKHITAKTVSMKVLGKYAGANSDTVVKAFAQYNMDEYKFMSTNYTFDQITASIIHRRLLTLKSTTGYSWHDVVLTGYDNSGKIEKIKIYDPNDDKWQWIKYVLGILFSSQMGNLLLG